MWIAGHTPDQDEIAHFVNQLIARYKIDPSALKARPQFLSGERIRGNTSGFALRSQIVHNCVALSSALEELTKDQGIARIKKELPHFWPELLRSDPVRDYLFLTPTEKRDLLEALGDECATESHKRDSSPRRSPKATRRRSGSPRPRRRAYFH